MGAHNLDRRYSSRKMLLDYLWTRRSEQVVLSEIAPHLGCSRGLQVSHGHGLAISVRAAKDRVPDVTGDVS